MVQKNVRKYRKFRTPVEHTFDHLMSSHYSRPNTCSIISCNFMHLVEHMFDNFMLFHVKSHRTYVRSLHVIPCHPMPFHGCTIWHEGIEQMFPAIRTIGTRTKKKWGQTRTSTKGIDFELGFKHTSGVASHLPSGGGGCGAGQ